MVSKLPVSLRQLEEKKRLKLKRPRVTVTRRTDRPNPKPRSATIQPEENEVEMLEPTMPPRATVEELPYYAQSKSTVLLANNGNRRPSVRAKMYQGWNSHLLKDPFSSPQPSRLKDLRASQQIFVKGVF